MNELRAALILKTKISSKSWKYILPLPIVAVFPFQELLLLFSENT